MQLYLPIAEMPVSVLVIIGIGAAIGFISGLLGVSGGFLLTPLLIFTGIPTTVAVGTSAAQVVASSSSAALAYWRRSSIDFRLAGVLVAGGVIGSAIGVTLFRVLDQTGQLELIIALSYVVLLGSVGMLMLVESGRTIVSRWRGRPLALGDNRARKWLRRLPWQVRFRVARIQISILPLLALGLGIGLLGSFLGVGGGFLVIPALIYFFRIPTNVVLGTSLLQIVGTMAVATVLHAVTNQSVDAVLALLLMLGGIVGAQFGARSALFLRGETLRALLAVLVLAVGARFLVDLVAVPEDSYSVTEIRS
ncbi:MAG: sulfite exporter TauE/SafE family protein [Alphaproteobacteria bacterium]